MRSSPASTARRLVSTLGLFMLAGCGDVACPDAFLDADGVCIVRAGEQEPPPQEPGPPETPQLLEPSPERCDGIDNDRDGAIDEDYFALGEPCGSSVGECVEGTFVCSADGAGVECDGAVGGTPEVCDGKDNDCDGEADNGLIEVCDGEDNDCDGLIDEGVLDVRKHTFDRKATVAAVTGGFVVMRQSGSSLLFESYDLTGRATRKRDTLESSGGGVFLESDASGRDVYVTWGSIRYQAAVAFVDLDLTPVVIDAYQYHSSWDQPSSHFLPAYDPPFNPQIVAGAQRVAGFRDLATFALSPFGDDLKGIVDEPVVASSFPVATRFDVANAWVTWQEGDNLRAALLLDNGDLAFDIDVGRGEWPSVAESKAALGIASVSGGAAQISELNGFTLQCIDGLFCNESLPADELVEDAEGPTGLAYEDSRDVWFMAASKQIIVVGRSGATAEVRQIVDGSGIVGDVNRVDVVVSGDTAAVLQSTRDQDSVVTFMGCF